MNREGCIVKREDGEVLAVPEITPLVVVLLLASAANPYLGAE